MQDVSFREMGGADEAARLLAEAKTAARAREEILAVVSHDLRSPLGTITDALHLLSRELLDLAPEDGSRLRKYLDTIARSTAHMTRLASDLLDLASIDAGQFSVHRGLRSIADAIHEARESFEARARKRRVRLEGEVEAGLPEIPYDKDRVLQVLGNLVSNALRFTTPGGSISLEARRRGQTVLVSVRDTGRGMTPDVLAHIFDRNWQASHRSPAGHGLGLAISKAIVEAHGGTIFAESTPGEGTSVSFSLPVPLPGLASTRATQPEWSAPHCAALG